MIIKSDPKDKIVLIIAGPNGAGKTTFAYSFLAPLKNKIRFINADNIAIERVAKRVSQGGHNIPKLVIQRRFKAGIELFHSHYKNVVNQWLFFDNSTPQRILLEAGENQ